MKYLPILIALLASLGVEAQNPGGVGTNLKAWYMADGNGPVSGTTLTAWNNQVAGGVNVTTVGGAPQLKSAGLNFNPTVYFSGVDYLFTPNVLGSNFISAANNSAFIVFTNSRSAGTDSSGIMAKWNNTNANRISWELEPPFGKVRFDFPASGVGKNLSTSLVNQYSYIGSAVTTTNLDSLNVNGVSETVGDISSIPKADPTLPGYFQIGGDYAGEYACRGNIAEIVYYDAHLTLTDRRKVETYLAIKYGITLGNTINPITYLASDAVTKPWLGSNVYQNNVAGVGRDDNAGLNQKQSTSVNINSLVTMALGSIAATNIANPNSFTTNKSFLLWGDDDQALSSVGVTDFPAPSVASRIQRVWRTQETGTVGTVRFRYSLAGTTLAGSCMDYSSLRLLLDADGVFKTGATVISPIAFNNAAQWVEFDVDFTPATGFYFSLGSIQDFNAPIVSNVKYCQNDAAVALTAIGPNLKWYTASTGGVGSSTAPIPVTTAIGPQSFWVSQSFGTCESARSEIMVTVNSKPTATLAGLATICAGVSTNLSIAFTGAQPWGVTYAYSDGTSPVTLTGITTNPYTIAVSPGVTKSYKITAVNDFNCTGTFSGTPTVTVNPKPTAILTGTAVTCEGIAAKLSVGFTGTSPWTITYTDGTTPMTISGITANPYKIFVTPNVATSYSLTAVNDANCVGTFSGNANVTLNNLPTATLSGNATICAGTSTNLSVVLTGAQPWNMTYTDGSTPVTISGITASPYSFGVNPSTTKTYALTLVTDVNCTATSLSGLPKVTVNSLPTATLSGNTTLCEGTITNMSVSLTGTQPWNFTYFDGTTSKSISGVTTSPYVFSITPSATKTYSITALNDKNCTGTSFSGTPTVTVNALPLPPTVTNVQVCQNAPAPDLDAIVTGTNIKWFADPVGGASIATPIVNTAAISSNSYYVTQTDVNTCQSGRVQIDVVVTASIAAPIVANESLCKLAIASQLAANGSNLLWYAGGVGGVGNATAPTPSTAAIGVTSYWVSQTSGTCESPRVQLDVTVHDSPNVTATASKLTICKGDAVTLFGGGASTYTWDKGVFDNTSFKPSSTQTYTVIGTDINSCTNTNTVTVNVNDLPTVTATASANTICKGDAVKLNGGGASTYTWDNGVIDDQNFSPVITATYTVMGTDVNTCKSTATVMVTVNKLPTVTASTSKNTICKGDSIKLNGGGALSFTWDKNVNDDVVFIPSITDSYTVTGTDANTCKNTAIVTVTVHDLPLVTANAANAMVCKGDTVKLNGGGASTYTWNNGVTNNTTFTPTATTTYTVTGTDGNSCQDTASITITQNELPEVTATASKEICKGDLVKLNGAGALTYTWDKGVIDNTDFSPTATATYTVTGTGVNTCKNTATTTVIVNELPEAIISTSGDSLNYGSGSNGVTLFAINQGIGSTYDWYRNDTLISTTLTNKLTDATKGNWKVVVTRKGCQTIGTTTTSVLEKNQHPIEINDTLITQYFTPLTYQITKNDKDNDGNILLGSVDFDSNTIGFQQFITQKDTGTFSVNLLGIVTFTPADGFTGTATIHYVVNDNTNNTSNIATVFVAVGPHIFDDVKNVDQNTSTSINVLANDIDADGIDKTTIDLDTLTAGVQASLTKNGIGTYTVVNGTVVFNPDLNYRGHDTIYYQVKDIH